MSRNVLASMAAVALVVGACTSAESATVVPSSEPAAAEAAARSNPAPAESTTTSPPPPLDTSTTIATTTTLPQTTTTLSPFARPAWLGTRVLDLRDDGWGVAEPTPPELIDRRLATPDLLPPPTSDEFVATIAEVPEEVLARSSWVEGCPLHHDDLRYITFSHHGFDGELHTGEMMINAAAAEDVVSVLAELFDAGYPIEEIRVTTREEPDLPPTGDRNVSGSFSCREAVGTGNWSQHAFGLAIDLNPFHNPYVKGDLVLPELASAYLDRTDVRPGMITAGDLVVEAFRAIGWKWGGDWNSLKDWMHFSRSGH